MRPSGPMDLDTLIQMINDAVKQGDANNCDRLVFDMRQAKFKLSFIDEYEFHKNLLRLTNVRLNHKCAVIVSYDDDLNGQKYGEQYTKSITDFASTVGGNWGTKSVYEFFDDFDEAVKWLKNA